VEGQTQDVGRDGEPHVGLTELTEEDSLFLSHELYLDAIMGVPLPVTTGIEAERNGWAFYSPTTTRHEWLRDKLDELDLETLIALYMSLKESQL
jgi:hypothetical protein